MNNAKNELYELLKDIGYLENCIQFKTYGSINGSKRSEVTVSLRDGTSIVAVGTGSRNTKAEIDACKAALLEIQESHQTLLIDWEEVKVQAQAGDAFIKLCAYLNQDFETAEAKSNWLGQIESDEHLTTIFDQLYLENAPEVALFGNNLGSKRKATWIEALIWQKYKDTVIADTAQGAFQELVNFLTP